MRELTKSMLRMSWALPLFGVKQMTHLAVPSEENQGKTVHAMDAVTAAAQRELGSTLEALYDTGDRLQRSVVDATFSVFFLDAFDPARWLPKSGGGGTESYRPAPSIPAPPPLVPAPSLAAGDAAPAPQAPAQPAPQAAPNREPGWGPMPG